jgi:protein-disulfide isomerase
MQEPGIARLALPVSQRDHRQGPMTAPATLIEYGDYECPYGIVNLGTELNNMLKYLYENKQHCSQLQRLPLSA